jgi:nudix-type nucleoside diphosphatase (YffH/AdpP family)
MSVAERVRVHSVEVLSDNWYVLKKTTFDFLLSGGTWQRQSRETYDRGDGAAILLYDRARRTVILTQQFRYPAFANGHDDLLIEVPAGSLDKESPEESIRKETMEETGYVVHHMAKIFCSIHESGVSDRKIAFLCRRVRGGVGAKRRRRAAFRG